MKEQILEDLLGNFGSAIRASENATLRVSRLRARQNRRRVFGGLLGLGLAVSAGALLFVKPVAVIAYTNIEKAVDGTSSMHMVCFDKHGQKILEMWRSGDLWREDSRIGRLGQATRRSSAMGGFNFSMPYIGKAGRFPGAFFDPAFQDPRLTLERKLGLGLVYPSSSLAWSLHPGDADGTEILEVVEHPNDQAPPPQAVSAGSGKGSQTGGSNDTRWEIVTSKATHLPTRVWIYEPGDSRASDRGEYRFEFNQPIDPHVFDAPAGKIEDVVEARAKLEAAWSRPLVSAAAKDRSCEIRDVCVTSDGTVYVVYTNLMHRKHQPDGTDVAMYLQPILQTSPELGSYLPMNAPRPGAFGALPELRIQGSDLHFAAWVRSEPGPVSTDSLSFAFESTVPGSKMPIRLAPMAVPVRRLETLFPDYALSLNLAYNLLHFGSEAWNQRASFYEGKGNFAKAYEDEMEAARLVEAMAPGHSYTHLTKASEYLTRLGRVKEAASLSQKAKAQMRNL